MMNRRETADAAPQDKLWRVEHDGRGPVVAIIRAPTSSAAVDIFRHHLEGYEGCYRSTGSQHVSLLEEEEPGVVCVVLRPF